LFQPLPEAIGDCVAVMVGDVLSKLTLAHAVVDSPVLSTALPQNDWFAPSVFTAMGEGQLTKGLEPGVHVKVTVTSVLFQPFEFGAGATTAMMEGAVGGAV